MRLVTCSMPPRIYHDELVVGFQGVDIPGPRPAVDAPGKPMLKDQGWAFALNVVVDTDIVVSNMWHDPPPIRRTAKGLPDVTWRGRSRDTTWPATKGGRPEIVVAREE